MDASHDAQHGSFTVVVTAPSSPETHHTTPKARVVEECSVSSDDTSISPLTQVDALMPLPHVSPSPSTPSRFENMLAVSELPEAGPAYFIARRQLWLTPQSRTTPAPSNPARPISAHLQSLLNGPVELLYKDSNWKGGVGKICERILKGQSLSQRLPLQHLVRSYAYSSKLGY
jgi:hypothetical protein